MNVKASPLVNYEQLTVEQPEFLKTIIDNLPGYVYWKDVDSVYMGCNQNLAKLLGLKSSFDIIGMRGSVGIVSFCK